VLTILGSLTNLIQALERGGKPNYFSRPEDHKNALHIAAEKGTYHLFSKHFGLLRRAEDEVTFLSFFRIS
jgi:hypothetical protein